MSAAVAAKVFVTDNLTRENQYILYKARQYRKEGKLFAAWSDVGKLKVRQRESSPTTVIRSLQDLLKVVGRGQQPGEPAAGAAADGEGFRRVTRSTVKNK